MIVYKNTVNLQEAAVAALKPGDYYTADTNGNTIPLTKYKDGTFGFLGKGQKVPTKVDSSKVKQVPTAVGTSSNANLQVLKNFKDGELKTRLQLRSKPFNKIYLSGGNLVVEALDHKTHTLCESLNINIPDYLLKMKEEKYTVPLGQTSLNFLLSDQLQTALKASGQEVMTIDCSSGKPEFLDANGQPIDLNKAIANANGQTINTSAKMSKNDMKTISNAVLTTLKTALNKFDYNGKSYKVNWEINNEFYDMSTLAESQLKEAGEGTERRAQKKMTNGSTASPFGIKATIINTETNEEETDPNVIKGLYKGVSQTLLNKLGNKVKLKSNINGMEYKTFALIQIQPSVKDNTFTFKAQMNVGNKKTQKAAEEAQVEGGQKKQGWLQRAHDTMSKYGMNPNATTTQGRGATYV